MTDYPHLLSPITLAGVRLRNRSLMGSMHTGLEETGDWGRVAAFYAARAKGGAGLIVTGGMAPNREGGVFPGAAAMHGVPLRSLELEITETGLMKDLQGVIPALHRLTQSGVGISIDDFGTGYSSLAYLTQLPICEVKIDRSFVHDLGVTEQSSAVITAIIALARALGLRVIAEGVENERQREVLTRLGCQLMQGYLFGRPLPAAELARWLAPLKTPAWPLPVHSAGRATEVGLESAQTTLPVFLDSVAGPA